ncbi:hypothetical protein AV530_016243 [Patagioenas fasciata monilis]|uniref:Uncharacterized protein n=1 Tax=Patagioenas fasciata monilis TaxID=372326 RepID=A0A1V4JY63_PATFA|nr:hypothetical protein AV530_016243 [Patagioenas fasciata monilis]
MCQIQPYSSIICAFWKILPKTSKGRKNWDKTFLSVTFWKKALNKSGLQWMCKAARSKWISVPEEKKQSTDGS